MTRDDSLTIVRLILSGWPQARQLDEEEIDLYARSIQDMDAELTTSTVLKAVKELPYRPAVAELRERVRTERRRLAPEVAPVVREPTKIPLWVKRWICARMLYARFNKPRDMRRFPEQGDIGDLTQEVMPEDEWLKEANSIDDAEFSKAFERMTRS